MSLVPSPSDVAAEAHDREMRAFAGLLTGTTTETEYEAARAAFVDADRAAKRAARQARKGGAHF